MMMNNQLNGQQNFYGNQNFQQQSEMNNPQMFNQIVGQVQQMAQKGADLKNILYSLKTQGFTPQTAEQILCTAFPKLKQIKMQIENSGMTTQQYINQLAKQNNIPMEQINHALNDFTNMLKN